MVVLEFILEFIKKFLWYVPWGIGIATIFTVVTGIGLAKKNHDYSNDDDDVEDDDYYEGE